MKRMIPMVAIFCTILFVSCQKEKSEKWITPISKAPIEKQYQYVRENFKKIIDGLAPLFKDPSFINYLYSEAAKKLQGENKILVESLLANPTFKSQMRYDLVAEGVNAFKNIDGETYHPQMYFPFFDNFRSKNTSKETYENGALVVFYDGDESVTTVPIYEYQLATDSFILTDSYANEAYAETHELIIIGIDEDDEEGKVFNPEEIEEVDEVESTINFRIKDINVKEGKETWLGGKTELRIKALGTTWNHRLNGSSTGAFVTIPPALHYATDYKGDLVKNIVRGEIGYPILGFNYPMNVNWQVSNYFSDPIVYPYVIFEYDPWPAGIKVMGSQIPTATTSTYDVDNIIFRSHNSPYGYIANSSWLNFAIYGNVSGSPSVNYQLLYSNGHRVNTDDIEFVTENY